MTIYRSPGGRNAIQAFASAQLDAWQTPHTVAMLDGPLGSTHVLSAGTAGEGPAVVMLAGTNFGAACWLDLIGRLAEEHRVHAVDLPGQPGLSHDERPRDRHAYGRWLAELLPRLDGGSPLVLGHSLGGRVALSAPSQGAEVAGLVLVDPAGLMRLRVSAEVLRPTLPWLRRPDAASSGRLLAMMMAPGNQPDPRQVAWMALVGEHVRSSLAPAPLPDRELAAIRGTPVVVLSGAHDAFLPADRLAAVVRRRLPAASFVQVERAGHLVPDERPDAIVAMVAELTATMS